MRRSRLGRSDPDDLREWRRSSAKRYQERLREEGRKFSDLERSPIRPVNPERRDREWHRAYGSEERVEWVRAQLCCVPGCEHLAENAHIETDGMGRKADADRIAPICRRHHRAEYQHSLHHLGSVQRFEERWGVDLEAEAEDLERRWQERRAA